MWFKTKCRATLARSHHKAFVTTLYYQQEDGGAGYITGPPENTTSGITVHHDQLKHHMDNFLNMKTTLRGSENKLLQCHYLV